MSQTFVIAIAGTSGAGKSTLMKMLAERLGNANALSLDMSLHPFIRPSGSGSTEARTRVNFRRRNSSPMQSD
jgi:uridine kinase